MHKLMMVKPVVEDDTPKVLHYLPFGATCCVSCGLSAPRMRMFYTDSDELYNAVDLGDTLPSTLPMLVDADGQRFRATVCSPCPF